MQIKECGSVVGVNEFNIMCNIGKYLECLQKYLPCNPKKLHTDISSQKAYITEIDFPGSRHSLIKYYSNVKVHNVY